MIRRPGQSLEGHAEETPVSCGHGGIRLRRKSTGAGTRWVVPAPVFLRMYLYPIPWNCGGSRMHQTFELFYKSLLHCGELVLVHMDQDTVHFHLWVGDRDEADPTGTVGIQSQLKPYVVRIR